MRLLKNILVVIVLGVSLLALIFFGIRFFIQMTTDYGDSFQFECENGLDVKLLFEKKVRDFYFVENFMVIGSLPHIHGYIEISNNTENVQKISTKDFQLTLNDMPIGRGYKETFISEPIDFASANVVPGELLKFGIYWPTDLDIDTVISNMKPAC